MTGCELKSSIYCTMGAAKVSTLFRGSNDPKLNLAYNILYVVTHTQSEAPQCVKVNWSDTNLVLPRWKSQEVQIRLQQHGDQRGPAYLFGSTWAGILSMGDILSIEISRCKSKIMRLGNNKGGGSRTDICCRITFCLCLPVKQHDLHSSADSAWWGTSPLEAKSQSSVSSFFISEGKNMKHIIYFFVIDVPEVHIYIYTAWWQYPK